MSSTSDVPIPETSEQTALACYLSAVVAIGNCLAEVCPAAGTMYRDRLLKLPRRLGFDATPRALAQAREAVETDLKEYAATAGAWIQAGSNHAAKLMEHLHATEETLSASTDLQRAFLEDMAEHIEASAEVDDEAQLRVSFRRYAAGLRAYSRRAKSEELANIDNLRRQRDEIQAWLAEATVSSFSDPETGLLNRSAAERRLETEIAKEKPFCVVLVARAEGGAASSEVMKDLSDRLASTVRPYDVIFRWSSDQLVTIFGAPESNIKARARQIAGWLGESAHTTVTLVEHQEGDTAANLIDRIESAARQEVAAV